MDNYIFPKKSELRKITVTEINKELPDLKNIFESKSIVIAKWLVNWIKEDLKSGKININDLLPTKSALAYKLGVSIGTMQNAFRYIEDLGYVESKQCIGTLIKDYNDKSKTLRKLTSKRELAIEAIKRYIVADKFEIGESLPSSRTIATVIGHSTNTTKLALEYLTTQGIIEHKYKNANEYGWILKSIDFDIKTGVEIPKQTTLVDKVVKDLENYINNNFNIGDKLPTHLELSNKLKASVKTIHDALKILIDKEIILPRRGKYGTTILKLPNNKDSSKTNLEDSIFAPAKDAYLYHYEKTQNHLKKIIATEYEIGDKLPSIKQLSQKLDHSPNTIRKALSELSKEGYLVFSRGRYGGTFVIDIPEIELEEPAFKWLAVDAQYAQQYQELSSN